MTMSDAGINHRNGVLSIVQNHVRNAVFKDPSQARNPTELSIVIPTESCSTSVFPSMFQELQSNKQSLGIRTIGMSLTTMEEVFIK